MGATNQFPGWKQDRTCAGHWTCFGCRKMFRKSAQNCVCPQCSEPMTNMGPYFEPPKNSAHRIWELLRALAADGYRFYTEGSRALFYAPRSDGRFPSARTVMARMRQHLGLR